MTDLRTYLQTPLGSYPLKLVELIHTHIEVLRCLPEEGHRTESGRDLSNYTWDVAFFACENYLLLSAEDYTFLLERITRDSDSNRAVFFLSYLTHLPVYDVCKDQLESALKRLSKETNNDLLFRVAEVVRHTDPGLLKEVHVSVLQHFVNASQRCISRCTPLSTEGGFDARLQMAPALCHLRELYLPRLAVDQSIRKPAIDSALEMHVSDLVKRGKWPDVEVLLKDSLRRDPTLCEISNVVTAIAEAMLESNLPGDIDKNYACLLDSLTKHGHCYIPQVLATFLAQLAATLIVYIDSLEA